MKENINFSFSRYLPTMPQDSLVDIIHAVNKHETVKLYTCPNGHVYSIGECGKPMQEAKCSQCGKAIGGKSHKLLTDNKEFNMIDKTMPGYCVTKQPELIDASSKEPPPSDTRLITLAAFYLESFLLNACVYLGIGDQDENIAEVKQVMSHNEPDPKKFFWNHMLKSIRLAARVLNLNVDEVILLWHLACKTFLDKPAGTLFSAIF